MNDGEFPIQLGHMFEVHSLNARNRGWYNKYRRPSFRIA